MLPEGVEVRTTYESGERYCDYTFAAMPRVELVGTTAYVHHNQNNPPRVRKFRTREAARDFAIKTIQAWQLVIDITKVG